MILLMILLMIKMIKDDKSRHKLRILATQPL